MRSDPAVAMCARSATPGARTVLASALIPILAGLLFARAEAQQPAPAASSQSSPNPASTSRPDRVLEPKAIEILKASSQRLAAAPSMSFTAVVSYESPSRPGPPLIYTTRSEVTVQRPDKLRVLTPGDGPASEFYYDGKTMLAFSPAENLAAAEAPPTIDAMLEAAYHYAAIYFPFTDLIVADPYGDIAKDLELAFYIGQSRVVGGVTTDMVAYGVHGVFVQVWIGAEDKLPRRARALFSKDPLQLRHQADFADWQLGLPVQPGTFASTRAATARRIPFANPDAPPPGAPPAQSTPPKTQ